MITVNGIYTIPHDEYYCVSHRPMLRCSTPS
jgi:hypothetical protein